MSVSAILTFVSIAFTIPVLLISYFYVVEFLGALRYPRKLETNNVKLEHFPAVSILIATFNEKFVISRTIDALKALDYPRELIQVVIADDSTDETRSIIDKKCEELIRFGFDVVISRRATRTNFKSGALNQAASRLYGSYVLLLDADSIVPPEVIKKGVEAFARYPNISFVSYRVGHYNREHNLTTRLYALFLDLGDTLGKMGAFPMNLPFSLQGGFALISRSALESVGRWSNDTIVEDADLSCKLYESGRKGVYLSNVCILSEDPISLAIWKRQSARVAQGWAKCISKHFKQIVTTPSLPIWKRIVLLLTLLSPFASLSWITVNFIAALSLVLGLTSSGASVFSSFGYVLLVGVPGVVMLSAGIFTLHVQRLLTRRNLLLIPLLSYVGLFMLTINSVGFLNGLLGQTGFFFRTPKNGHHLQDHTHGYSVAPPLDRNSLVEVVLSISALILSVFVLELGVWLLSLFGFAILTAKSMNLLQISKERTPEKEITEPILTQSISL